jgi:hypothetical protein
MPTVLVAVAVTLLIPASRHEWAISLIRQPTRYTELYFDHPTGLPTALTSKQPIAFTFTIANRQGTVVRYPYVISVMPSDQKLLSSSIVRIGDGHSRSIRARVVPDCLSSPCQIKVSLTGYPESIDFIVTEAEHVAGG